MIGSPELRTGTGARAVPVSPKLDTWLLMAGGLLVVIGLLALYSVGHASNDLGLFRKQFILFLVGLVPFFVFLVVDPGFWRRSASWLYVVNLAFLALVLVKGPEINGAKRWIELGFFQFQPSEVAKLLIVLTLSAFYANRLEDVKRLPTFLLSLLHILPPLLLILKQPHLGAAMVILVAWAGISICAGVPWRYLVGLVAAVLALFVVAYSSGRLHSYQIQRIDAIFNKDEKANAYQQMRASIAFGAGGLGGTGYLKGEQKTQVPEHHNDFIFTVIGEEGGLIGCTLVLMAFAFFFYRAWLVLYQGEDPYSKMVAAGILSVLAFHTVLNLGMNLDLLPVVGLWLPFLSYGGTAMWLCLAYLGLLLNLNRREQKMRF